LKRLKISISKQKQFEIVDNQFIDLRTYQETKISNESFSFLGKKQANGESFSFLGKKQANGQTDENDKNSKEILSLFKQLINKNETKEEPFELKPDPQSKSNDYIKRLLSNQTTSDTSAESFNKDKKHKQNQNPLRKIFC